MEYHGDLHSLQTADGNIFVFPDEASRFLVYIGYGAPPIEYVTRRGYKQHGTTKLDQLLQPRQLTIDFWRKPACDRATYWANRAALHDMLRPNRGGSILMTLIWPDGTKRAIYLDSDPGAQFNTSQVDDNNWEINEALEFTAFNPVWFNADQTVLAVAQDTDQQLVFPITFPIHFGPGGLVYTTTINYVGNWLSYPILTITGPYDNVTITHEDTGAVITLIVPILAGESRIIDLTPGAVSVVDGNGDDKFSDLGAGTDFVDFAIKAAGIPPDGLPNGINTISAAIVGSGNAATFTISYSEKYYAI